MSEDNETRVLLKLDFRNAFNTVHRDKMLLAVSQHIPQFYGFVWQMYRQSSLLSFGEFMLQSSSGVQQGDPLGPLLYCLLTREMANSMHSPLNAWYLDDATVGGPLETVERDLLAVVAMGRDVGLELNFCKCEALVYGGNEASRAETTNRMRQRVPEIKLPSREELTLLGAPLLPPGVATALEEKTAAISLLTSRLSILQAHQALFLLKNCLSAPKVLYTLRSSPAWMEREKLRELDNIIRSSLATITNTDMTDSVWRQATLPVSRGGLGIRRTDELALPA